eukprot:TRINITY_DN36997_c1_g2_i2.p1 TRINITY_DN36997_c1_g2~~TRINITY_DN36997_c1_g2_i2.p1  ORF type:complete len:312 (-),score=39.86 TRINITY_DN36997_c1_g2_i2:48-983(-)
MGFGLQASEQGVTEVAICVPGQYPRAPLVEREAHGVHLLLGNAANCAAAIETSQLGGLTVTDVVCVASGRNARTLETQRESSGSPLRLRRFEMNDWLRPDDIIDIPQDCDRQLRAVHQSIQEADEEAQRRGDVRAAVLVHCDMGCNRAPTLVLAFLVSCGLTLRQAYRFILSVRPGIDPLPPYRRGLESYEMLLQGQCTVNPEEPFCRHISELMAVVQPGGTWAQVAEEAFYEKQRRKQATQSEVPPEAVPPEESSGDEDDDAACAVDRALALREEYIRQLIQEDESSPSRKKSHDCALSACGVSSARVLR